MPRVEELELEPRNVPQRPLKREVKREGVQGKTRARASDVSRTAQSLRMFVGEEEGGSISFVSVLSAVSIYPCHLHLHLHPLLLRHFGSDQLPVHKTRLRAAPPCLLSVSHSLSCERCDLWTDTGSSVCV